MSRFMVSVAILVTSPSIAVGQMRQIDLPGPELFPEGIAIHSATGQIFVGGLNQGEILVVEDGVARQFKGPGEDGLLNTIGMAVDAGRNRLWVASTPFLDDGRINGDPNRVPAALAFDTRTGDLLATLQIPVDGRQHFLNDADVDALGNVYFTDSLSPIVWRIDVDTGELEQWVEDTQFVKQEGFNLNGVVVTPDQRFVLVTVPGAEGSLFRIDLITRSVVESEVEGYFGGDGLVFAGPRTLISIAGGITVLEMSESFSGGSTHVVDLGDGAMDFPTTGAIYGPDLFIVNSQLDHLVPMFGVDAPPEIPFTLTVLPLLKVVKGVGPDTRVGQGRR